MYEDALGNSCRRIRIQVMTPEFVRVLELFFIQAIRLYTLTREKNRSKILSILGCIIMHIYTLGRRKRFKE